MCEGSGHWAVGLGVPLIAAVATDPPEDYELIWSDSQTGNLEQIPI